jgi:hypothetical protein
MSRKMLYLAVLLILCSCRNEKDIVYVHDTINNVVNKTDVQHLHDSIYVDKWHTVTIAGDTVRITDSIVNTRTQIYKDTIRDSSARYEGHTLHQEKFSDKTVAKNEINLFYKLIIAALALSTMYIVVTTIIKRLRR